MLNLKEKFLESSTAPLSTVHNGRKILAGDRFPILNKDILIVTTEKTNSKYRQGFCFDLEGYIKYSGQIFKEGKGINFFLWESLKPHELQFFTKKPYIFIRNVWVAGLDRFEDPACYVGCDEWRKNDQWAGAGMIVEEIENGRRYYCNDGECDDDFDDIIFTVTRKTDAK